MNYPGFIGDSYVAQSVIADAEELINWYVQSPGSKNAKTERVLYPTPGVAQYCTLTDGPVRGSVAQAARTFVVGGATPFEITDMGFTGMATALGAFTMARDANPATLCTNNEGGQLFITSGNAGYIVDLTTLVLTKVLDNVLMGAMLDTFFLALDPVNSLFKISASGNGLVWDPTQFAARSSSSDPWRSMLVGPGGGELWLFGDRTSDIWYNKGTFPFPFAPITSAKVEQGIAAPFSAAWLKGPIWLAQNINGARTVQRARGYSPVKISTEAIDHALANYDIVSDAEGFVYEEEGHTKYVLNLPSANATWVFDDNESSWHKQQTWNSGMGRYDAWRARNHVYNFNKHLVGDRNTGTLYLASINLGLDFGGAPLRRLRRTNGLQRERQRLFFSSLELYLETGLATLSGQGSDPMVQLRTSRDGGKTFGSIREKSAGKRGKYTKRVRWNQIGAARDRVDEIVVTDPIPWRIISCFLEPRGNAGG